MNSIVLFCEALRNRAGIERMTVDLANLLSDTYKIRIITIDKFSADECPFEISDKVDVLSLNSHFGKSILSLNLKNILQLRRRLREYRPQTVIAVATPMVRIAAPAAFGLGINVIGWEHFNIFAGSKIGAIYKALCPWFVKSTVVLTEADANDFRRLKAPRIKVIPNFTNIGKYAPSECENKILLAVGRHAPQKGFDMLIKAWADTDAPGWKLRIVGSGEDKVKNEALAQDLGIAERIEFKESHPEIMKDFQEASCFVLSSRFEGLVLVLIEAKMMGLPCVSFDCPNSPREVIRDGEDGWLVENGNIEALAATLARVLGDMDGLKLAGKLARDDARKRYSPLAVMKEWNLLIE